MGDGHTLAEKPVQRYGNAGHVVAHVPPARLQGGSPAHDAAPIPQCQMAGQKIGMSVCQQAIAEVQALALGIVHLLARNVRMKRRVLWLARRC